MRKPINITIDPQIDTDPAITYLIRVEGGKDQIFDLLDHAEECGCESYEIVKYPAGVEIPASRHGTEFPDNTAKNSCGCCQDPPCRGCKEEAAHPPEGKMIDITPTWPEMVRIIAALMESGTDTGKRAAFDELMRMADVVTTYRIQRDEAIIHANNIIREARTPIMAAGKHTGGYWNAVDNFRRFEIKTI